MKVWNDRASKERDPVSKFVFLWFCFNATIAFESNEDYDSEMIKWLKTRPTHSLLLRSYESASGSSFFLNTLQTFADLSPIEDPRGGRKAVRINGDADFAGVLDGLYRVRCNLFHGSKRANDARDTKLVKTSARILEKWIGNLLTEWNNAY